MRNVPPGTQIISRGGATLGGGAACGAACGAPDGEDDKAECEAACGVAALSSIRVAFVIGRVSPPSVAGGLQRNAWHVAAFPQPGVGVRARLLRGYMPPLAGSSNRLP